MSGERKKNDIWNMNNILISISLLFLIGVSYYNHKTNNEFWIINIGSVITIFIAIIFAYLLNQRSVKEREQKSLLGKLFQKMQIMIQADYVTRIENENHRKQNMIFQRSFDNRLNMLIKMNYKLISSEDLNYIKIQFDEYRDIIGDDFDNIDNLKSSEKKFNRIIENIDFKLDELLFNIYKM